ncbi:MAG: TAXI family TRAP transporter solute-binding subunit [Methylobacterium sp.]|jgi:TRAP-type uncharacterized transport system substrate-binding protein|uniref:TAXI family TRAP transporter solute-binding subunit n=1 Tax=unclassified Methylobacterium TaxID=2615210 RepID=UPI0006F8F93A|nr:MULTISPECIES: TAXI family TRAP transporter solute-binding subunit [unclassified Methylobacterium]KQP10151.1 C4-dicarboxylate ABC transporter substrate-binding protein [Methylobacterium sp. Leaf99]MDO9428382.1 TAXI family TRAP transporter solute-binding subunit [Methylobacterium sp.]
MPAFLLRREWLLVVLALGLAALAGAVVYLSRPTTLTVAVGPRDGAEATLLQTYARALARGHEDVRLKVVPYDDVRDSAEALQRSEADLAVVRPDVLLPENGLTLAILHDEALLIVAPASAAIESFPDLSRKRLGIVERHQADVPFVTNLLGFYDFTAEPLGEAGADKPMGPARVALVPLKPADVTSAVQEGRVDAVAVIAAPASKAAISTVRAVEAASTEKQVTFVSVPDGEAIIQRMPELQSVTIPAGTFGGRPKRPEEDVKTVGASYRLMARGSISRFTVASVTQHLFEWRSKLAPQAPIAKLMKAPDFDSSVAATSARLPNHPGAVDYFEREQQTLFERYEDYIYLLAFFGGTIGSGIAWLGQRLARERRERIDVVLDRLLDLLREVRGARTQDDLDGLVRETDSLVADVVQHARARNIDTRTISALILAIDAVHAAVNDARRTLDGREPEATRNAARTRTARLLALNTPAAE